MRDALGNVQTVAVLGGGSDIGAAIARRLVGYAGATRLVLAGRNAGRFEAGFADLAVSIKTVEFDAVDVGAHEAALDEVFTDDDVDVAVLAFGVLIRETGIATDITETIRMLETNYLGSVSVLMHTARRLARQGHGHLVVLSSIAGQRSRPDNYLYGSTRAGLDFVARGMQTELAEAGIELSIVRPGFVHSKMTEGWKPAPFSVTPTDIAKVVAAKVIKPSGSIVWVPPIMRLIAAVLKVLPVGILTRLR